MTDITSHAAGNTPVSSIVTSITAEVEIQALALTGDLLAGIIGPSGRYTPSAAGSTELSGLGRSRLGEVAEVSSGELRLVPKQVQDGSRTFTIHKAVPSVQGWNYSSTEQQAATLMFKALLADGVNESINLWSFGNPDQNLRES